MAEQLIVVDDEKVSYEGIFDMKEVFNVMKQWMSDTGYWMVEKNHTESSKPDGKFISLDLIIFKKFTDYAKSLFNVKVEFYNVKDTVIERDGKKIKMQEGKVIVSFNGILETDYENRWENKPVYYFLRTVFEKYIYLPYMSGFESSVRNDLSSLKGVIKAFLNVARNL